MANGDRRDELERNATYLRRRCEHARVFANGDSAQVENRVTSESYRWCVSEHHVLTYMPCTSAVALSYDLLG